MQYIFIKRTLVDIKKGRLILLLIFTFLLSCTSEVYNETQIYYYNAFSEDDNIRAYYKRVCIINEKGFRTDSIFRYNLNGKLTETDVEYYKVEKNRLSIIFDSKSNKHIQTPYLSTLNRDCLEMEYFYGDLIEICFLGEEKLLVQNIKYNNSLKFNRKSLTIDGVENVLFFDENFVLIREELKAGSMDYYRIDRAKEKPKIKFLK